MGSSNGIQIRRAADRFVTRAEGRETFHSFSFGVHYDPENTGFAAMVAHNDEHLAPGSGYDDHPHRDLEIVTWVLEGALRHTDSTGASIVLGPGELLRTSAGTGIVHSEVSEPGLSTRFVQTWLRPDEPGEAPSFAVAAIGPDTGFVDVVGRSALLEVGTRGARLRLGRIEPGPVTLPDAPRAHLFVADGVVEIDGRVLRPGDAVRLHHDDGRRITVTAAATVAVWAFDDLARDPA